MIGTCILFCIKELAALFSFLLVLARVFGETPRSKKRLPLFAAACVCVWASAFLLLVPRLPDAYEYLDMLATLAALIALPVLFRKPAFLRSVAVIFVYFSTVEMLWSFVSPLFSDKTLPELIFELCVYSLIGVAVWWLSGRRDVNVLAGAFAELPWWMVIALFLFEVSAYYKEFGLSRAWYDALYAVSACLVFLSILWLAVRVLHLIHTQKTILQRLSEQLLYETQRDRSDESLRRFRHDFKNHSIVLNSMLEKGDLQGARRYMDEISSEVSDALPRFSTGNPVVNSLLNVKYAAAARQGTELRFDGMIPERGIASKDMCVCVGNLLDNAIEACAALPESAERYVKISASAAGNVLLLTVENPAAETARVRGGALPKTTKKDAKLHGIGLKNVRDTAKKYNGTLQLTAGNGRFTAELLLELRKETGDRNEEIS